MAAIKTRMCRACGHKFTAAWPNSNQQHCSQACSRISALKSRRAFHKRNPTKVLEYGRSARKRIPDNRQARLLRRYPELPRACQSCGEDRVLEVAHRPGFGLRSAWRNISNSAPHMIWILCPTCHKLLDKGICTPEELGLVKNAAIA